MISIEVAHVRDTSLYVVILVHIEKGVREELLMQVFPTEAEASERCKKIRQIFQARYGGEWQDAMGTVGGGRFG